MSDRWITIDNADEPGVDPELQAALRGAVDPASDDPNYWFRFRAWVVESAGPELARRRIIRDVTVGDVMSSWARTLVPTALMAAVLAGVLMVRQPPEPSPAPLSMEELLISGLDDEDPIPSEPASALVFASERF